MPTDEEIKAARKAENKRIFDSIKTDVVTPGEDDENKDKKKEEIKEEKIEKSEEVVEEVSKEEEIVDTNEEKIEEHETNEEELKDKIENAANEKERDKFQKRLNREVAKRKTLEEENTALKAQLAAKPDAALTEEEVEKRSQTKAQQLSAQRDFVKTSNRLFDEAEKLDKDFDKKVKDMADDIGPIPSVVIGIIGDFKRGDLVLKYFADNHEEAEEYFDTAIKQPIKAAAQLKELEVKLTPKVAAKSKVKVNEPVTPTGGAAPVRENMTQSMDDWVKTREARLKREGKY